MNGNGGQYMSPNPKGQSAPVKNTSDGEKKSDESKVDSMPAQQSASAEDDEEEKHEEIPR